MMRHPDRLRADFSAALSAMYRAEVPLYGELIALVAEVNANSADPRLEVERHGAIRLGTENELRLVARLFARLGLHPVGYYDLAPAGVPVHSTAFRPVGSGALVASPFRVFASLLRPELIADQELRDTATALLERRRIATPRLLELLELADRENGVREADAAEFVAEAVGVFRWRRNSAVEPGLYDRLRQAHPLVADVACFPGPHLNHLTPRARDIDAAQALMRARGMNPKAVIEGPPRRAVPILLRQTSFQALSEPVRFAGGAGGTHTARFGEIEQRGVALTPKGRALFDRLLSDLAEATAGGEPRDAAAARLFRDMPDEAAALREDGLAWFDPDGAPITYEDFLPVSAAGIFRSNLGDAPDRGAAGAAVPAGGGRDAFAAALGRMPLDEMALYRAASGTVPA